MAGMVKKKNEDTPSPCVSDVAKNQTQARQVRRIPTRGIPTAVFRNGTAMQLDNNRNSKCQDYLSNESLEGRDKTSNGILDHTDRKTNASRMMRSGTSVTPSPLKITVLSECDNRSRPAGSASPISAIVRNHDVNKPVNEFKASLSSPNNANTSRVITRPSFERSHPASPKRGTVDVLYDGVRSVSRPTSSKKLQNNRNYTGKNANRISSSNEMCATKLTVNDGIYLQVERSISPQAISLSADHLAVSHYHRERLLNANEAFVSDNSVTSEPAVHATETTDHGCDINEMVYGRETKGKAAFRARSKGGAVGGGGTAGGSRQAETSPRGPLGSQRMHHSKNIRQSGSNERKVTGKNDAVRSTSRQRVPEISSTESMENENNCSQLKKGSGTKSVLSKDPVRKGDCTVSTKMCVIKNAASLSVSTHNEKSTKTIVGSSSNGNSTFRIHSPRNTDPNANIPEIIVSQKSESSKKNDVMPPGSSSIHRNADLCDKEEKKEDLATNEKTTMLCHQLKAPVLHNNRTAEEEEEEKMTRRLFHARSCASESCKPDSDVELIGLNLEPDNLLGSDGNELKCSLDMEEEENVVVIDRETYHQMLNDIDELKTTIACLQDLLQVGAHGGENSQTSQFDDEMKASYEADERKLNCSSSSSAANIHQTGPCIVSRSHDNSSAPTSDLHVVKAEQMELQPASICSANDDADASSELRLIISSRVSSSPDNCLSHIQQGENTASMDFSEYPLKHLTVSDQKLLNMTRPSLPDSDIVTSDLHSDELTPDLSTSNSTRKVINDNELFCLNFDDTKVCHCCGDVVMQHCLHDNSQDINSCSDDSSCHSFLTSKLAEHNQNLAQTVGRIPPKVEPTRHDEDEEFAADDSMFDYSCSVDSDYDFSHRHCEAAEMTDTEEEDIFDAEVGQQSEEGILSASSKEHCFFVNEISRAPALEKLNSLACRHDFVSSRDECNNENDMNNERNICEYFIENGFCDNLGIYHVGNCTDLPPHLSNHIEDGQSQTRRVCRSSDGSNINRLKEHGSGLSGEKSSSACSHNKDLEVNCKAESDCRKLEDKHPTKNNFCAISGEERLVADETKTGPDHRFVESFKADSKLVKSVQNINMTHARPLSLLRLPKSYYSSSSQKTVNDACEVTAPLAKAIPPSDDFPRTSDAVDISRSKLVSPSGNRRQLKIPTSSKVLSPKSYKTLE